MRQCDDCATPSRAVSASANSTSKRKRSWPNVYSRKQGTGQVSYRSSLCPLHAGALSGPEGVPSSGCASDRGPRENTSLHTDCPLRVSQSGDFGRAFLAGRSRQTFLSVLFLRSALAGFSRAYFFCGVLAPDFFGRTFFAGCSRQTFSGVLFLWGARARVFRACLFCGVLPPEFAGRPFSAGRSSCHEKEKPLSKYERESVPEQDGHENVERPTSTTPCLPFAPSTDVGCGRFRLEGPERWH